MKARTTILALTILLATALTAQDRYFTRDGNIKFFSETPVENIEAVNEKASSVWDVASNRIEFSILMKAFQFEKALMQEHFNENYVESDKFPKAVLRGKLVGMTPELLSAPGVYEVTVSGELTLHGVTKPIEHKGTFTVKEDGGLRADATFLIVPEDYDIAIPKVVRENIAQEIEVTVGIDYTKM